jgi:hypothetical protein
MYFPTVIVVLQNIFTPGFKKKSVLIILSAAIFYANLFFSPKPSVPENQQSSIAQNDSLSVTVCSNCHKEIYESFIHTAHYLDSRPADTSTIKGSFEDGKNIFTYNPFMQVQMEKNGAVFSQSGMVNGEQIQTANFDISIGSGRKGQSYLYWSGDKLFQLPVSYYAANGEWCNSPGFPGYFFFGRQITANCLECHTTYARVLSKEGKQYTFDKNSIVYGITCERCHPGAARHATYQMSHPEDTTGRFVVNTANLERSRRTDACALCHSGFRIPLQDAFLFKAGDTLSNYSTGSNLSSKADTLDVHGNQYGLLAASQCFKKSLQMDCSTCHNVHETQINEPALFSKKCLSCHSGPAQKVCSLHTKKPIVLADNCIDCHMPVLASKKITVEVDAGKNPLPDYIRTHYISVYKNATKDYLKHTPLP